MGGIPPPSMPERLSSQQDSLSSNPPREAPFPAGFPHNGTHLRDTQGGIQWGTHGRDTQGGIYREVYTYKHPQGGIYRRFTPKVHPSGRPIWEVYT